MTTVRSAISATTPMSCVMKRTDMPSSSCSVLISSRICAWMVTSSAVVGSSAIRSLGLQASAIAIITRWRMPPEKRCGYSWKRDFAEGIFTFSSRRIVSASASERDRPRCRISASAIWKPMVSTGFSEVIGSWKIIAMSLPRIWRICASGRVRSSLPLSLIEPSILLELGGVSRMIDSAVTLLPEPDSPTTASVSCGLMSKEMLRTTGFQSPSTRNEVVRFETERIGEVMPGPSERSDWAADRAQVPTPRPVGRVQSLVRITRAKRMSAADVTKVSAPCLLFARKPDRTARMSADHSRAQPALPGRMSGVASLRSASTPL